MQGQLKILILILVKSIENSYGHNSFDLQILANYNEYFDISLKIFGQNARVSRS